MNKKAKYGINGALIVAAINAIINAVKQLNAMDQDPNLKFDWSKLLIAGGKGAAIGGLGGLAIGAIADYNNSQVKPINTDKHLSKLTSKIRLDKTDPRYLQLDEKAVQLANMLMKEYGDLIQSMPRLGSTEAGTALKEKFDIDLGLNFRANSFRSTEEMFFSVLSFFKKKIGKASITRVRIRKNLWVFTLTLMELNIR